MVIKALQNGDAWNGVQVKFISNQAAGDQALVQYDAGTKTLSIDIRPGVTTARTVVAAINQSGLFGAQLDDQRDPLNDGSGVVDIAAGTLLAGGRGFELDRSSGIQVVNRGETFQFTFENAETVEDLLNQLNYSEAGVVASLNSSRTGIDVRSRISGADFAIGENGGTTASELGIRTFTDETPLGGAESLPRCGRFGRHGLRHHSPRRCVAGHRRLRGSDGGGATAADQRALRQPGPCTRGATGSNGQRYRIVGLRVPDRTH